MIFPIVLYGDPVLKRKAKEVQQGDESVKEFISNLYKTMYAAQGIGLAAPQVGYSLRIFVVDTSPIEETQENRLKRVFINPVMISEDGEPWTFEEGCLSLPGIREDVTRKPKIHINYFDEYWKERKEEFDGIKARVIQHEYDHIEGILFTDYVSSFKKRLLKGKLVDISKGKIDATYQVKTPKNG